MKKEMKTKSTINFLIAAFCAIGLILSANAHAQEERFQRSGGPFGRDGADQLVRAGLEIGTPLPDLTAYDANGQPFKLSQLKGHYSVIVFGCLT
ncbi:hypothetical protein IH992_10240 [Candidatus Poribacteria bacterium]|nr:hypothetical protein [Candidatus Poribacteria bacterium]